MTCPDTKITSVPRGRRRSDQPSGRDALLQTATQAFAQQSFEATSLRAVASAAGVSQNLVSVHFNDKAGLWAACVATLTTQMQHSLSVFTTLLGDERETLENKLEAVLDLTAQFYLQNPATNGFIMQTLSGDPARGEVLMDSLLRPVFDASRPLLEEGIAAGLVRAHSPAIVTAIIHLTLGHSDHFMQMMKVMDSKTPDTAALQNLAQTLKSLLLIGH